jgi:carotenoid cleavage dioxygenase
MKTEIHHRFESGLPADDTHPYRTGAWRPQTTEYDAWELDVEGAIPDDLCGVYLRNTENPLLPPIERYHPFDGDGMLHSISFAGGEARYHNRFVRTDGFLAEREAGESLWAGVAESPKIARRDDGWGARTRMKDASSTDIVVHRGVALSSFWMCGDLYRFDPFTLEQRGKEEMGGRFPAEGVSAHPKIDENTGEMLFFNYGVEAPHMHYGVISPEGALSHYVDVPLPGPRLPHDMAFTENYAILNDCPMFWDPKALAAGHYATRFFPELPTRFGVIPRRGGSEEIRWFEADPTFVLHWMNAYEEGDEIILDGFFQENPSPERRADLSFDENLFRYLDLFSMRTKAHRWRFDLKTGACREEHLSDRIMEFGMMNGRHGGRPYRYSYNALPEEGWFGFKGVVKQDLETGSEEVFELPPGVYASETVMAPREGSSAEDDGYLITFTMDVNEDRSECVILDAANPCDAPIARVALPERICSGTHAFWHAGKAVATG